MLTTTQQLGRAVKHWRAGQKAAQAKLWTNAAREFQQAVKYAPDDAGSWHGLAVARITLSQMADGTAAARRAFELAPESLPACKTLVDCLMRQNRHAEAVDAITALAPGAEPDHELLVAHGTALFAAKRPAEAVPAFIRALALNLANPLAHFRMGLAFKDLNRDSDANMCFQTALATDKSGRARALVLSQLVYGSRLTCEWDRLEEHTAQLLAAIDTADDESGSQLTPFTLLALDATPQQQLRVGQLATQAMARDLLPLPAPGRRRAGRVRVGYLSADFNNHATALLITELLERRDTARFEVFLYSHSPEDGSTIQLRVRAAGDHYIDVSTMADLDIAKRMRDDGIDIAVDLKGHTRDSRFRLLAHRPAPVQVAYLGYPGTSGAEFIDYLIGDPVVTPLDHAAQYSEKIAQLPDSYQPNDRRRSLPPAPARADEGLPEDAVVLCCFNQIYKISPRMLDLWARILQGAPNTVLWMLTWTQNGHVNLSRELEARGVDLDRVLFAPKVTVEQHIARLRCADLFLDTWPCNAHTTASEALWAGVPVLTVPGPTYASRVAASLVAACGQPEMACADEEAYVQAAIRLAQTPKALNAAKAHLDTNRMALPLFDTDRYTRNYEALLMRMFERRQAGLAPDHLAGESVAGLPSAEAGGLGEAAPDRVEPARHVSVAKADRSNARVLYREGGLGDVLMALAAAKAIRQSTGEPVVIVTNDAYASLAKACPHVDRVISTGQLGAAEKEAVSRSRSLGRFHDLNPVSFGTAREHQVDAYLWHAGIEAEPALKQLELDLPADTLRAAIAKLDAAGVGPGAIVLHPAVSDPNRTWPHERWEALCAELVEARKTVVLIGAAEGHKSARGIAGQGVIDLIGQLDLFDTLALLRRADALVTVDGGPLHLAGASDVAIVGLFSVVAGKNRMPFRHGQAGWRSLAIESDCPEFPCYRALNRPEVYTRAMTDAQAQGKGLNDVFATWCPNEARPYACMQQGHGVEHVISALRLLDVLDTPRASVA